MCGRYTLAAGVDELVETFGVPLPEFEWAPRYNIAPGQRAPVVASGGHGLRAALLTWGFVSARVERPGARIVNARAESVRKKSSFREAFERRRCLVPADGFYEWKREGRAKVPFWFHPKGKGLLAFAGLWETWSRPGAKPRHTFVILTTEAGPDVAAIHGRMPAIVRPGDWARWLDRGSDPRALEALLGPSPAGTLVGWRVGTRVNRVAEDDAGLVEPAGDS
jgi:putative SOS response-associated peptidase YedK